MWIGTIDTQILTEPAPSPFKLSQDSGVKLSNRCIISLFCRLRHPGRVVSQMNFTPHRADAASKPNRKGDDVLCSQHHHTHSVTWWVFWCPTSCRTQLIVMNLWYDIWLSEKTLRSRLHFRAVSYQPVKTRHWLAALAHVFRICDVIGQKMR